MQRDGREFIKKRIARDEVEVVLCNHRSNQGINGVCFQTGISSGGLGEGFFCGRYSVSRIHGDRSLPTLRLDFANNLRGRGVPCCYFRPCAPGGKEEISGVEANKLI